MLPKRLIKVIISLDLDMNSLCGMEFLQAQIEWVGGEEVATVPIEHLIKKPSLLWMGQRKGAVPWGTSVIKTWFLWKMRDTRTRADTIVGETCDGGEKRTTAGGKWLRTMEALESRAQVEERLQVWIQIQESWQAWWLVDAGFLSDRCCSLTKREEGLLVQERSGKQAFWEVRNRIH